MEIAPRDTKHHIRLPALPVAVGLSDRDEAQLKDELLSVLLHDLRSPLGAVGVLSDVIAATIERDGIPDGRQMELLQEAVTKAQRILDDAVEIQSIIRGSSALNLSVVDLECLVSSCLEKASHAPYFRNTKIENRLPSEALYVRVDLEKIETIVLCLLEQFVSQSHGGCTVDITGTQTDVDVFVTMEMQSDHEPSSPDGQTGLPAPDKKHLRGRLGTRRLGESRYNFQVCRRALTLMGGGVEFFNNQGLKMRIRLPQSDE